MNVIHVFLITGVLILCAYIASAIYFHKQEKAE